MDRQSRSKMNTQIYEEACTWFVECRAGDLDDAGRREFDRWLRKSPEHLSSYLEIAAIWNEGPLLDPQAKWSADALIEHAMGTGDDNVVPLLGVATVATNTPGAAPVTSDNAPVADPASAASVRMGTQARRARSNAGSWLRGWRRFAIAASVLAILGGVLAMLEFSSPIYATALGEQRSIQFEDGSTVELNSRSKVRVRYSKQERDVELIEGQALFHVAHDTNRPFIVAVGATRVRAVGTQFDVYKKSNGTVVTVVEGRVVVYPVPQGRMPEISGGAPTLPVEANRLTQSDSPLRRKQVVVLPPTVPSAGSPASNLQDEAAQASPLSLNVTSGSSFLVAAGEQVTVTAEAARRTANPNIAGATAWREREIVFEYASLSEVAEEFNRYNERQLVIKDPALYGFHISGVFSSTDPDSLIKFLRQRQGVKVTEAGAEIRVEREKP